MVRNTALDCKAAYVSAFRSSSLLTQLKSKSLTQLKGIDSQYLTPQKVTTDEQIMTIMRVLVTP